MNVDNEKAVEFFKKIKERSEWGSLDEDSKKMIKDNPELLKIKCPGCDDEELEDWQGFKVVECLCAEMTAGSRDLLVVLVEAGAEITDKCYSIVSSEDVTTVDFYEVLLASGHLPSNCFYLDVMVDCYDGEPLEDNDLDRCMEMLLKRHTLETCCGFGSLQHLYERSCKLPVLKAGVTHSKGGPFAKFKKEWLKQKYGIIDEKSESSESDEEESEVESEPDEARLNEDKKRTCAALYFDDDDDEDEDELEMVGVFRPPSSVLQSASSSPSPAKKKEKTVSSFTTTSMHPRTGNLSIRLNRYAPHFPVPATKNNPTCSLHQYLFEDPLCQERNQVMECDICNVSLCVFCFKIFHTVADLHEDGGRQKCRLDLAEMTSSVRF